MLNIPPYWPACGEDSEINVWTLWSASVERIPLQISPPWQRQRKKHPNCDLRNTSVQDKSTSRLETETKDTCEADYWVFRKYQNICLFSCVNSTDLESSRWSEPHLWLFAWSGEQQSWIPPPASTWAAGWPTCRTGRWLSHLCQDATVQEKIKLSSQDVTVLRQFTRAAWFNRALEPQPADHSVEMQQGRLTSCVTECKCRCLAIIWSGCDWNINDLFGCWARRQPWEVAWRHDDLMLSRTGDQKQELRFGFTAKTFPLCATTQPDRFSMQCCSEFLCMRQTGKDTFQKNFLKPWERYLKVPYKKKSPNFENKDTKGGESHNCSFM